MSVLLTRFFSGPAARMAALALLAAGTSLAQSVPSATVRLLAFSRVGAETQVDILGPDGVPLAKGSIPLPTQQVSSAHTLTGRSLVFTAPADPKKILGRANLPENGHEFILVFLPASRESATPYQVDVVPMPASSFGSGDYAFFNYSGSGIGCLIEGEKLVVPQGKVSVYHAGKSGKGDGNRKIVCYQQQPDARWDPQPFFSSRIIIQQGVRNLILICLNPQTRRIDFRGVADFVGE